MPLWRIKDTPDLLKPRRSNIRSKKKKMESCFITTSKWNTNWIRNILSCQLDYQNLYEVCLFRARISTLVSVSLLVYWGCGSFRSTATMQWKQCQSLLHDSEEGSITIQTNETAVSPGRTRKWTTGTPEGWHRKSKGWGGVRWTSLCLGPEIGQSERDQQKQGASSPCCWLSWHKAETSLRTEVKVKQADLTRTHYSGIKQRI